MALKRFGRSAGAFFKVIFRNKRSAVGLLILLLFVFMATIGTVLVPLDMKSNRADRLQMPSWEHWLGTDTQGRDTLSHVVHGSREVLSVGVVCAVLAMLFGVVIGAVGAFLGGVVDTFLSFITNIFLTIPAFPLMLILATSFNVQSIWVAGFILALVSWGGAARVVRGQILSLKHSEYIVAARVMNLSTPYIIFREILPNTMSLLSIQFIGLFQGGVTASMGMMLMGALNLRPYNWGYMLTEALGQTGAVHVKGGLLYFFIPIVCLALLQLGCIFFSSGLDEALNPRLRTE